MDTKVHKQLQCGISNSSVSRLDNDEYFQGLNMNSAKTRTTKMATAMNTPVPLGPSNAMKNVGPMKCNSRSLHAMARRASSSQRQRGSVRIVRSMSKAGLDADIAAAAAKVQELDWGEQDDQGQAGTSDGPEGKDQEETAKRSSRKGQEESLHAAPNALQDASCHADSLAVENRPIGDKISLSVESLNDQSATTAKNSCGSTASSSGSSLSGVPKYAPMRKDRKRNPERKQPQLNGFQQQQNQPQTTRPLQVSQDYNFLLQQQQQLTQKLQKQLQPNTQPLTYPLQMMAQQQQQQQTPAHQERTPQQQLIQEQIEKQIQQRIENQFQKQKLQDQQLQHQKEMQQMQDHFENLISNLNSEISTKNAQLKEKDKCIASMQEKMTEMEIKAEAAEKLREAEAAFLEMSQNTRQSMLGGRSSSLSNISTGNSTYKSGSDRVSALEEKIVEMSFELAMAKAEVDQYKMENQKLKMERGVETVKTDLGQNVGLRGDAAPKSSKVARGETQGEETQREHHEATVKIFHQPLEPQKVREDSMTVTVPTKVEGNANSKLDQTCRPRETLSQDSIEPMPQPKRLAPAYDSIDSGNWEMSQSWELPQGTYSNYKNKGEKQPRAHSTDLDWPCSSSSNNFELVRDRSPRRATLLGGQLTAAESSNQVAGSGRNSLLEIVEQRTHQATSLPQTNPSFVVDTCNMGEAGGDIVKNTMSVSGDNGMEGDCSESDAAGGFYYAGGMMEDFPRRSLCSSVNDKPTKEEDLPFCAKPGQTCNEPLHQESPSQPEQQLEQQKQQRKQSQRPQRFSLKKLTSWGLDDERYVKNNIDASERSLKSITLNDIQTNCNPNYVSSNINGGITNALCNNENPRRRSLFSSLLQSQSSRLDDSANISAENSVSLRNVPLKNNARAERNSSWDINSSSARNFGSFLRGFGMNKSDTSSKTETTASTSNTGESYPHRKSQGSQDIESQGTVDLGNETVGQVYAQPVNFETQLERRKPRQKSKLMESSRSFLDGVIFPVNSMEVLNSCVSGGGFNEWGQESSTNAPSLRRNKLRNSAKKNEDW